MNKLAKYFFYLSFIFQCSNGVSAQILFSESFSVIIDTNKRVKGNITPDFKFQTQKENLLEFQNLGDITFRLNKKNAFSVANKIELSKYGKNVYLSGGYVYGVFRRTVEEKKLILEPYSQFQWADARGLELKYAGGINARYKFMQTPKVGLFLGTGPFFEFERWNYNGVRDSSLIVDPNSNVTRRVVKQGSYLSLKYNISKKLFFDLSLYHQSAYSTFFKYPRLGAAVILRYNLTANIGVNLIYNTIYDFKPLVPINPAFQRVWFTLSISM